LSKWLSKQPAGIGKESAWNRQSFRALPNFRPQLRAQPTCYAIYVLYDSFHAEDRRVHLGFVVIADFCWAVAYESYLRIRRWAFDPMDCNADPSGPGHKCC
jgi:hypothetical protein